MNLMNASKPIAPPPDAAIDKLIGDALAEDLRDGDLTAALIAPDARAHAQLTCRESAVLCGALWFARAFARLDSAAAIDWHYVDGDVLQPGDVVCDIRANTRAMMSAERVAINLLQTLSGTASITRRYVDAVAALDTRTQILDTRKTIPGLRAAQKYAVAVGGGVNHRFGLFDAVLIKENHITAAGGMVNAVAQLRAADSHNGFIEVEVESLAQLQSAIDVGVDRVLLDNFDLPLMKEAVALAAGRVALEVSGNVSFDNLRDIAATGVDYISIGALTKHLTAVDFSLRVV